MSLSQKKGFPNKLQPLDRVRFTVSTVGTDEEASQLPATYAQSQPRPLLSTFWVIRGKVFALRAHCVCTACALRAHCSETHPMPPLYDTAKQQSQQDTH